MTTALTLPPDWRHWPPEQKRRLLSVLEDAVHGRTDWYTSGARENQRPPTGSWFTWLILTGRGWGKTRTGAEWAIRQARHLPRGALVAPTAPDARDVLVEGESGIRACAPGWFTPEYEPTKRRLTYPNGAIQTIYSADEPDRLRGPQHHYAWADEWAAMRRAQDLLDMLRLGLRLGDTPRLLVTTTPRPTPALRKLIARPGTVVTTGTTYENLENLAGTFRDEVLSAYEGTRLGRQEIHGELLEDVDGALWTPAMIDDHRQEPPDLTRVVVGVDPAVTAGENSDETGIVVVGERDGHLYVLADLSGRFTPSGWADVVAGAYDAFGADRVVAEVNNGGDLVGEILRRARPDLPIKQVHASRAKRVRAEPIAALYERGRVHHHGVFTVLEDQLMTWVPGADPGSPDRMDALVWAATALTSRPDPGPVRGLRT